MITVRNRNRRPSSFLFDPFFYGSHPVKTNHQVGELKPKANANIIRTENGFDIEVAAPGFSKEEFNITIDNNKLKIAFEKEPNKEKVDYAKQEFVIGSFTKSFELPKDIDQEKITAQYELGVLTIHLERAPKITKKINIQ